jgi:hypothetical protein
MHCRQLTLPWLRAVAPPCSTGHLQGFNDQEYKSRRYMLAMRAKQHTMWVQATA